MIFNFFFTAPFEAYFKMRKNHELNEFEREKIISLRIGGKTHKAISRILKIPKSTVTDTISRYNNFNTGLIAKRNKRLYFMNNDDHHKLSKIVKKNNRLSLDEIQQNFNNSQDKNISAVTIRRNLHQMEIYSRISMPKPLLTESQCEK